MTQTGFKGPAKEIKIVTVVGARPQFIKAATVRRAIDGHNRKGHEPKINEILIHTGQHYDYGMSEVFFEEMQIPHPMKNLNINSCNHGEMTGRMIIALEAELKTHRPDWVLVYGDTNSTLAGALSATKLHIPVAHVEAGLRSYNRRMPEEINRVLTDHIASVLLCPTRNAEANLEAEGITGGIFQVGDVMYDSFLFYQKQAMKKSTILAELGLKPKKYFLATIHREENTGNSETFLEILNALKQIGSEDFPIIFPLHPGTRKVLKRLNLEKRLDSDIRLISPVSYFDMISLETHARMILTDSGGVQKEAYFAGVPCVTLREETEWIETTADGWNHLGGTNAITIMKAYQAATRSVPKRQSNPFGTGNAAQLILRYLTLASQKNDPAVRYDCKTVCIRNNKNKHHQSGL